MSRTPTTTRRLHAGSESHRQPVCSLNAGSTVLTSLSVLLIGKISTESSQAHYELQDGTIARSVSGQEE